MCTSAQLAVPSWRRKFQSNLDSPPVAPPRTRLPNSKPRAPATLDKCEDVAAHKPLSQDQLAALRQQHAENVKRAAQAKKRQAELDEAAMRKRWGPPESAEAEAETEALAAAKKVMAADAAAEPKQKATKNRGPKDQSSQSPNTVIVEPLQAARVEEVTAARRVWPSPTQGTAAGAPHECKETFSEEALRTGPLQPLQVNRDAVCAAVRDGFVIVPTDDGFGVRASEHTPWLQTPDAYTPWWRRLAQHIRVRHNAKANKAELICDGGLGFELLGSGNFNIVVRETRACRVLPLWLQGRNVVMRITRPDHYDESNDTRYLTIDSVVDEAVNAMFASCNGIGVQLHAIACYEAYQPMRTLRYGSVHVMDRAFKDLHDALRDEHTAAFGHQVAIEVIELLYRASRCGVAFYDCKPTNILCIFDVESDEVDFRLTDCAPDFFLVVPDRDWQSLLLLNVVLLTAHVRNGILYSDARAAWVKAVAPLIRELLDRRDAYDGGWLFGAHAQMLRYELCRSTSTHDLQRFFAVMCTSYFYGPKIQAPSPSERWPWLFEATTARAPKRPLIEQLALFAISE